MDENRRPTRHLDSRNGPSRTPTDDAFRASTADSGLGSISVSERPTTLDSRATNGTLSSLSRDTPINDQENTTRQKHQDDKPICIRRTRIWGTRCYEQAYVSHVDHPSAFFLQLPHNEERYAELYDDINEFYTNNPTTDPSIKWKRGDYCIAKYKDSEYSRARIIEVPEVTKTPGLYDVVFLDYGNWDKVASIDIHSLLPKFTTLPAQAIPCSLTESLPRSGSWFDHPMAIKLFESLVLGKHVDVTVYTKSAHEHWPLVFVDLKLSSSKLDVRTRMIDENLIRKVSNEDIYRELIHLIKPADLIIYSIPNEDEENDDDDI